MCQQALHRALRNYIVSLGAQNEMEMFLKKISRKRHCLRALKGNDVNFKDTITGDISVSHHLPSSVPEELSMGFFTNNGSYAPFRPLEWCF